MVYLHFVRYVSQWYKYCKLYIIIYSKQMIGRINKSTTAHISFNTIFV